VLKSFFEGCYKLFYKGFHHTTLPSPLLDKYSSKKTVSGVLFIATTIVLLQVNMKLNNYKARLHNLFFRNKRLI